jgi:outer membrane protein TolC
VARLTAQASQAGLARARLTLEADVRRAYLDLLQVRDRLALLARRDGLWVKAEAMARIRYETGDGAQSDLLRAQLERTRLRQRRAALLAEEKGRVLALGRLRGRPLDEPLPTTATVASRGVPVPPEPAVALADAEARSPELAAARSVVLRAERSADLARRDRWPDLAVSAAIMPRGAFDPMWSAGVSVSLPIFAGAKQARTVAEQEARAGAVTAGAEAVRQQVRLRVEERQARLAGLLEEIRLYQGGLLAQSQATAESTLAQYRVGRVTFASVLEALAGVIGDEEAFLQTLAEAQRLAIAAAEVSLAPVGGGGGAGGSGGMPGAGAVSSASGGAAGTGTPADSGGGDASAMNKM